MNCLQIIACTLTCKGRVWTRKCTPVVEIGLLEGLGGLLHDQRLERPRGTNGIRLQVVFAFSLVGLLSITHTHFITCSQRGSNSTLLCARRGQPLVVANAYYGTACL